MLKLKTIIVAVSSIASGIAFAGTMGPVCSPEHATIPCETKAWDVGIEGLYLKAVYNQDHGFAGAAAEHIGSTPVDVYNARFIANKPDWGLGFKLQGSHHFSTGKDANLNWLHYLKTSSQRFENSSAFTLDALNFGNSASGLTIGHLKSQLDAINLEFGQLVQLGDRSHLRYHGGAQYARMKGQFNFRQLVAGQDFFDSTAIDNTDYSLKSVKYNGFGPRFGADLNYDLMQRVEVYGNVATALLIGTKKAKQDIHYTIVTKGQLSELQTDHLAGSTSAFVPELEAKLGLAYTCPISSGALKFNLGYMWLNYFNLGDTVSGSTDFGLHGVNFGMKWIS